MHIVLDPHSAPSRPVDAGLNRHNGAFHQRTLRCLREPRRFMHLQADAVAEAMSEQISKTAVLNVAPRDAIGIPTGHAWAHGSHGALICEPHNLIYLALFQRRVSDDERARDV